MKNIDNYVSIDEFLQYAHDNGLTVSPGDFRGVKVLYMGPYDSEPLPVTFSLTDTPSSFYGSIFIPKSFIRVLMMGKRSGVGRYAKPLYLFFARSLHGSKF